MAFIHTVTNRNYISTQTTFSICYPPFVPQHLQTIGDTLIDSTAHYSESVSDCPKHSHIVEQFEPNSCLEGHKPPTVLPYILEACTDFSFHLPQSYKDHTATTITSSNASLSTQFLFLNSHPLRFHGPPSFKTPFHFSSLSHIWVLSLLSHRAWFSYEQHRLPKTQLGETWWYFAK